MEKLMKIDRRILYLIGAILVVLTLLYPLGLPVSISPLTEQTYDSIQNLPDGSLVILSPMYDAGAMGELHPMFTAMFYQLVERGYKVVIVNTSWIQGPQLVQPIAQKIADQYNYVYGQDWINLGSKPGGTIWLQSAVSDFINATVTDYSNQPVEQFAIMQLVPELTSEYVAATLILDCGTPGARDWLAYVNEPTGIPLIVGEIQMSVPEQMPFVQSGQYVGMIAGSRGAAEYEQLVGRPGKALQSQDTMSVIALMIAAFILIGNIGYLGSKKK